MRIPLLAFLLALAAATPASADTFAVDNGSDGNLSTCSTAANGCTRRGALTRAEATPDADTITLPKLRIALTSPLPQISMPVTIKGTGARSSTVDGAGSIGTVFTSGFGSQTVLRDLKVTGAK